MNYTRDGLLEAARKLADNCIDHYENGCCGCPFQNPDDQDESYCALSVGDPDEWDIPKGKSEPTIWERIASDGAKWKVESDGTVTHISEKAHHDPIGAKGRDAETRPPHYDLDPEPIKVIKAWNLDFCFGNVLKYLARAGRKEGESRDSDLHKAMTYLRFALEDEGKGDD